MSSFYTVLVDETGLKEAIDFFEFVGGNTSDALRIGINKTLPKTKTAASRAIRDQVRLSASYVGGKLTVRKATRAHLQGSIGTPIGGMSLSRYSTDPVIAGENVSWIRPPLVPAGGIRVKVKPNGPAEVVQGLGEKRKPFYIVLNHGRYVGIAARLGFARKPYKIFQGPSVSQVYNTVRADLLPAASDEFQFQILDAMRYILVKKYPPEPTE